MPTVLIVDEHSANRESMVRLLGSPEERCVESADRSHRSTTLFSLDLRLRGERDPQTLLQVFCHATRDLIGAQCAVAGITDKGWTGFSHIVASGLETVTGDHVNMTRSLMRAFGEDLRQGKSLRITGAERIAQAGLSLPLPRARTLLAVPVSSQGTVHGWLCLLNRKGGGAFTENDERLAGTLGAMVGRIYANGIRYKDLLQRAERIEKELADREVDGVRDGHLLALQDRAIKAATQGIIITDPTLPDSPIVYVSPGFERTTGYRASEILGRNMRLLQGRETDPTTLELIQEKLQAAEPVTVELLNYRKDHTPFWNQLSISPVRDDAGRLTHFVALHTDVTERRRLEDELRQSQKMETVGQLAGGVAHDFNNLLTVINVNAEIALENLPPGSPLSGMIAEIKRAGELSAELTRRLLTFSRRQIATPQLLSLNQVVADTERFLQRLIGEDIELSIELAPKLGVVRADPGLIEQALLNLAVNARDSMPTGGRLRIATRNVVLGPADARPHLDIASGPYAVLSVSDTGCGIPPDIKSRLFEPFFTTKKPGQGTGLGLSTVYGIVKQTGGHIDVESEPGSGSTFEIFLPAIVQSNAPRTDDRTDRVAPHGDETVLVVEDDARVRGLINRVLTTYGYQVLETGNAVQAIDLAGEASRSIDLVLTDIVLPGMGGRALALRVVEQQPRAKVLFVSGYADDAIVKHGVLQEQVHFLQKPFTSVELAKKVRETLDAP